MMLSIPTTNAVFFPMFYSLKKKIGNMRASVAAGLTASFLTTPLFVVKTRIQAELLTKRNKFSRLGMFKGISHIAKTEGFISLYKGFSASLIGLSHPAIFFPFYEFFKKSIQHTRQKTNLSAHDILTASVLSKFIASSVTYPHLLIRTKLMNANTNKSQNQAIVKEN